MPPRPPQPMRGSPGGGLGKKVGGLPVWAWALAGVAAVGLGLYLRKRLASSTGTSAAAPAADTGSGGSAGGGPGSPDTSSLDAATQASEDLAGALNGLTAILSSSSGGIPVAASPTDASLPLAPAPSVATTATFATTAPTFAAVTSTDAFGNVYTPVPAAAGGGYVVGGVYIPGSIAGQPLTTAQIEAYRPPPGEVAQHYPPQTVPPAPVATATHVLPAPSAPRTPAPTNAGVTAKAIASRGGVGGKALR